MTDKKDNSIKIVASVAGLAVLCFVLIIAMLFGTATLLYMQQSAEKQKQ